MSWIKSEKILGGYLEYFNSSLEIGVVLKAIGILYIASFYSLLGYLMPGKHKTTCIRNVTLFCE